MLYCYFKQEMVEGTFKEKMKPSLVQSDIEGHRQFQENYGDLGITNVTLSWICKHHTTSSSPLFFPSTTSKKFLHSQYLSTFTSLTPFSSTLLLPIFPLPFTLPDCPQQADSPPGIGQTNVEHSIYEFRLCTGKSILPKL